MAATHEPLDQKGFSNPGILYSGRPRILVADVAEGIDDMEPLLGQIASVTSATSLPEAIACLRAGVDAVIVGVHFDESRMLDLLRSARSETLQRLVPFVCYRAFDLMMEDRSRLEIACKALDAVEFVDLCDLQRRYGKQQARAMFLDVIHKHLPDGKMGES